MIRRSVKIQLAAFVAIALVAVSFLSARFIGLTDKVLGGQYVVTADFADSGGIFSGAEVTYRGVTVGKVDRLRLTQGGVLVDLRMNRTTHVPRDTIAVVENRSAVGEQYVDLQPRTDSGPYLRAGSRIPRTDTRSPTRIDTVMLHLDRLVGSVDNDQLSSVVGELGTAFGDRGHDLQRLLDSGDALTTSATESLPQTLRLIHDGTTVLDTQREQAGSIRSFSKDLADLSDTVRTSDGDLRKVLDRGAVSSREMDALLRDNRTGLATLLTNLVTIGQVTDARLAGVEHMLVLYPAVVAGGFTVIPNNESTAHFGLVLNSDDPPACTRGYGGTKRIDPRQTTNLPPTNTGARCTEPRGSRTDVRGAQNAPRPDGSPASSVPLLVDGAGARMDPTGASDATVSAPVPPDGATGTDAWSWMLLGGAR